MDDVMQGERRGRAGLGLPAEDLGWEGGEWGL